MATEKDNMPASETNLLIEAGHYYSAHGPTIWSQLGLELARKELEKNPGGKLMLFVDNYHGYEHVPEEEKAHAPLPKFSIQPNHVVYESHMTTEAEELLSFLTSLPKSKRARLSNKDNRWYISGFPITKPNGNPACVLLDAALTKHKYQMGYNRIINYLPNHYGGEQANLSRLLAKIMPSDFHAEVVLFDQYGNRTRQPLHTPTPAIITEPL